MNERHKGVGDLKMCGNCRFYGDLSERHALTHQCSVNPPTLDPDKGPEGEWVWTRPIVDRDDSPCRHWEHTSYETIRPNDFVTDIQDIVG